MTYETQLAALVRKVSANKKYHAISPDLVTRLSKEALSQGLSGKLALKTVRKKLHQVGGAYFRRQINYQSATNQLEMLPADIKSSAIKAFCIKHMQTHASTAERLPILETFYHTCLEAIAPITSVLDLACGLNPLAIPWMPLSDIMTYQSCDIYRDMMSFIQSFFQHVNVDGHAQTCDVIGDLPKSKAQIAFLLKSIPCLEQIQAAIGPQLLTEIEADHILVSFPVRSLGGRQKGMLDFYRDHFCQLTSGTPWTIQEFIFDTELAFLVSK